MQTWGKPVPAHPRNKKPPKLVYTFALIQQLLVDIGISSSPLHLFTFFFTLKEAATHTFTLYMWESIFFIEFNEKVHVFRNSLYAHTSLDLKYSYMFFISAIVLNLFSDL